MALMRGKKVPKDAVAMTEMEATTYAWDLVSNWESASDTWALKYGPVVLGGLSALSGVLINSHLRRKLKLGTYGYFSSVIPMSVMPGLMTSLFHRHLVSTGLLLMKNESCPICYEIRSAALQVGFGLAYPLVLGPTAALMLAHRYNTSRVPSLLEGPKVVIQFVRKTLRPYNSTLTAIAVCHLVTSSVITYFEMRNNFTMRKKITEIENKVLAEKEKW